MKHIKLFENWAEELEVREYMKENGKVPEQTYTVNHQKVKEELQKINVDLGWYNDYSTNFQHFYELEELKFFRTEGYDSLKIGQWECKYQIQDFDGLPEVRNKLGLNMTQIKSLKGLENRNFKEKFLLKHSLIENLKYCPESLEFCVDYNPLLSYYGIKSVNIEWFNDNLCGQYSYMGQRFTEENLYNIEFHAEQFCNFKNREYDDEYTNRIPINPWFNIYNDPNDVENFEFLFHPFYMNSENFREKAKEYINEIDLGKLRKEKLW